ncbi:AAA family ATPase [Variovorax boronicumulans]|uniref:AAA family ATPase n=1 Tax=Variovorax boronicumulans TaxID=436515 RepID=UPI001C5856B1
MILISAKVGPFRSMNTEQTVQIDPSVTVFVGMNEAGKTVLLKALQKSADAVKEFDFQPVEDYPRKDLSSYTKRHDKDPATATVLTYILDEKEILDINSALKVELKPGFTFSVTHLYDNTLRIGLSVQEAPAISAFAKTLSSDAATAMQGAKLLRQIPGLVASVALTPGDEEAIAALNTRLEATKWDSIIGSEAWIRLASSVPKFLYFSDYDTLPGKMNLTDLASRVEQAKTDPKQLKPIHRAVLALLRMADVSFADLATPGGYEELKAKIEAVSISLTDQVMEFWKQNEDLEVEVDIKTDPADDAPFDAGPNLYLRIKNRRHRGVSTPFDQRSRGFIWFFSFLVWFDTVQHQLDPSGKAAGKKLILLLDEPGLALHALAQADFLRYIDRLAEDHQVLYTTHSPFMVNSDRLHQVRLVEDQKTVGTVISSNLNGSDPRTIFPLQAALGWTIAQNLFISERNLLVEGPSELIYLQVASGLLEAKGGVGLRSDLTIVPTGGLDNVATFVALLAGNGLKLAVLHDFKGSPEQRLTGLVREKLLAEKSLFNVSQFRDAKNFGKNTVATDVEDLFAPGVYLKYFNLAFASHLAGKDVSEADLPQGDRIVQRLEKYIHSTGLTLRPSGGFNHYLVASQFATSPPKSLDAATSGRFAALFAAINDTFDAT